MRVALAFVISATLHLPVASAQQPAPKQPVVSTASGFAVQVQLSPAAARRLAGLKETVTVTVDYHGTATPAREGDANFDGDIELGRETVTLPATGGLATVTGAKLLSSRLSWVVGRQANVRVTIASSRRASRDNLLNCLPYVVAPLAQVRGKTHHITCRLIGEPGSR